MPSLAAAVIMRDAQHNAEDPRLSARLPEKLALSTMYHQEHVLHRVVQGQRWHTQTSEVAPHEIEVFEVKGRKVQGLRIPIVARHPWRDRVDFGCLLAHDVMSGQLRPIRFRNRRISVTGIKTLVDSMVYVSTGRQARHHLIGQTRHGSAWGAANRRVERHVARSVA